MSENVKHKSEPVTPSRPQGLLEELKAVGVYVEPRVVLNLYGPPMVGKSVLALHVAREVSRDGRLVVLASEPSYEEPRYLRMLEEACGYLPEVRHVRTFSQAMVTLREVKDGVLVVDSVSALADREASYWLSKTPEPRVVTARIVPQTRALALAVRQWANERGSLAVMITHATSTAGAFRYRGIIDLKPSLAMRAGHYIDYELLLTVGDEGERVLTVVASRTTPWSEGRSIRLRFTKGGVSVVK